MFDDPHLRPRAANFQPLTPVSFLTRAAEAFPEATAAIWRDARWDYAGLHAMAVRMARALRAEGRGPGDDVSILARNRPEMLAAHFAVPAIGAVLNTLNTRLDADALAYMLGHCRSRLLLCDPACCDAAGVAARAAGVRMLRLVDPGGEAGPDRLDVLTGDPDGGVLDLAAIREEWQPICLNYTSGTTGAPKGAVYHHRGAFLNAMGNGLALGFGRRTTYLWTLPMFHCNGWSHTWAVTAAGGTHVCLDEVEPAAIFDAVARHGVTHLCCAPVVLYMLLASPAAEAHRARVAEGRVGRVAVGTGGAAPSPALIEQLGDLGFDLTHLYGLTESYGPATICETGAAMEDASTEEKAAWLSRQGFCHASSGTIRVAPGGVGAGDGDDAPDGGGSQGEILLRGNTLMAGYFRDAEATERAFDGGWFHTGDLGRRDADGAIRITDREKDLIISGGENIASIEVEGVLQRHPSVLLAAVVAMPDEKWGERPCAFVEVKPGRSASAEELESFCRSRLAGYKVPRDYRFGRLPTTATGKIQKYLLRERLRGGAE